VPRLVSSDAPHGTAHLRVSGALGLDPRDRCAEGLSHAAFDCVLESHLFERPRPTGFDMNSGHAGPGALGEPLHHPGMAYLVACSPSRGDAKPSGCAVCFEFVREPLESVDGRGFEVRQLGEEAGGFARTFKRRANEPLGTTTSDIGGTPRSLCVLT
jgi:hypothetical protein